MRNDPTVAALQREREGYVRRGLHDRVALVDAELERLGVARPAEPDPVVEEAGGGAARRRSGRRGG